MTITAGTKVRIACDGPGCKLALQGDSLAQALCVAEQSGWDWYTGKAGRTRHFCRICQREVLKWYVEHKEKL